MKITINQKEHETNKGTTVGELLKELNYGTVVVFINDRKLNMAELPGWALTESDRVKIIRVMAGG